MHSPLPPPRFLPLSVLTREYHISSLPVSAPTPVFDRVHREYNANESNKPESDAKRVRAEEQRNEQLGVPLHNPNVEEQDEKRRDDLQRPPEQPDYANHIEYFLEEANQTYAEMNGLQCHQLFEGMQTNIVPSTTVMRSRYEAKNGEPLAQSHAANLYVAMNNPQRLLPTDAYHVNRTRNWIIDEYDFSHKYGVGYMFSNGTVGVLFNDKTTMICSANGNKYEYYGRVSICQWNQNAVYEPLNGGYIDMFPEELSKKITLIKYFYQNFLERKTKRKERKEEIEDRINGGPETHMPFVVKWMEKDSTSIFLLSTGAILARFDGGTIMNFEMPFDDITYLDKYEIVRTMSLYSAVTANQSDVMKRLQFITNQLVDIVKRINAMNKS